MAFWEQFFGKKPKPGYPAGFDAIPAVPGLPTPTFFDPAFTHFPHGFRKGDPVFSSDATSKEWHNLRSRLISQLLKVVSESDLRDLLILRGSVLLHDWFGDLARRPKDIDWVVADPQTQINETDGKNLLLRLVHLVEEHWAHELAEMKPEQIVMDDIWTYERAPGKRITIPYKSKRLPHGFIQMDVVFGEELWVKAIEVHLPNFELGKSLLAASIEQSLAWKLLWLSTDHYPEGKDLYDAVLLAEKCPISFELLKTAYSDNGRLGHYTLREDLPLDWDVDWENFQKEYPNIKGTVSDWKHRLFEALKPAYKVF